MPALFRAAALLAALLSSSALAAPDRDPFGVEIDATLARLQRQRGGLEGLVALQQLDALRPQLADSRPLDAAVLDLAEAARCHPLVRDHARWLGAQILRRQGEVERARMLLAATGLITRVGLLGPFENTGGNSFADPALDETDLDLEATHSGLHPALSWRVVEGGGLDGYLDLAAQLQPDDETLSYLLIDLRTEKAQSVALRIGTSDQICVRVGAETPRCFDQRHRHSFEQRAVGLRLVAGSNPVLLRLGHVEGPFRTSLRLTRPDGAALPSGAVLAQPWSPPRLRLADHATRFVDALDLGTELARRAERARGAARVPALADLARWLEASQGYDRRQEPDELVQVLKRALAIEPARAALWRQLGRAQLAQDPNAAREAFETSLIHQPDHPAGLLALGRHRLDRQLYREALPLLRRAAERSPDSPATTLALTDALSGPEVDPDDPARTLEAYVDRHRVAEHLTGLPVQRRWLSQLNAQERHVEAVKLASQLLVQDATDSDALRVLRQDARRRADLERVEALLRQQVALRPQRAEPRRRLARFLTWNGHGDRAQTLLEALRQQHPQDVAVLEDLGEARLRDGDREGAAAAWRRSLALRPQQPTLKRRLDALAAATRPEVLPPLDLDALRRLPVNDADRPFGVEVLAKRSETRLFANGLYSTEEEVVLRLLDRDFARALKTQQVGFSPGRETVSVLVAERIDRQGRSLPPAAIHDSGPSPRSRGVYSDRRAKIVRFDQVEVGDLVHLRTRTDAVGETNLFGDFYGQISAAQGQWPVRRFDLVVDAPRERPLSYHSRGLQHAERALEGTPALQRYHFWTENLPGHRLEPGMPPLFELVPYASISTYASWEEMTAWYARLIAQQYQLDEETRALARQLVEGVAAEDLRERVRRIHRHVVKQTRYVGIELGIHGWKPYRASQVQRRGYGDCKDKATLLVAMLDEVGVDARLVMLRTVSLGTLEPKPATMWAFNHAIAYVPGLDLFLDGTAEFSGIDELPTVDQGALALVVDREGRGELRSPALQPASANLNRSRYTITLQPGGDASLEGEERFRGARAARLRQRYEDPATRQELLEREFSESFAGAQVQGVEFGPLEDLDQEVWYRFRATLPGRAQRGDDGLRLPIPLYPHELVRAYAPGPERLYDVVVDHPWQTHNVMRYQLPPGHQLARLPEPLRIDTPHLRFEQRVERTDDGFVVDELTELRHRRIPLADYSAFRAACLEADAAMQQRLLLVDRSLARVTEVQP